MTASQSSTRHLEEQVVAGDAGVVDQDGRRAELGGDALDGGLDRVGVGDVGADRERPAAGGVDASTVVFAGGLVEVEDGDGVAVRGQPQGGGRADAACGAGDDGGTGGGGHAGSSVLGVPANGSGGPPEGRALRTSSPRPCRPATPAG